MAKKTSAKDVMKPHSEAKVNFYQKYLETHLLILSCVSFVKEIHIYDLFCGRGIYKDGKLGSAIRAYQTIREIRKQRPSDKRIVLHLNDKNKRHIVQVKQYIEDNYKDEKTPCNVIYTTQDASLMLKELANRHWFGSTTKGVLNVFFIDPYGYKPIRKEFLENLLQTGDTEILLFLPISFMHRFTNYAFREDANKGALPLRHFVASFFPEGHPMREDKDMDVQEYIDYLTEAFSFGGKLYTTSYPIERNQSNHFALFFFSTNLFGYEKVLNMKWKMMDSCGFGFHLPASQMGLFDQMFKEERLSEMKELFRVKLIEFLTIKARTNKEIYKFTVTNDFLPTHAKDVLRELQDNEQLEIVDMTTGEIIERKNKFLVDYNGYKNPTYRFQII